MALGASVGRRVGDLSPDFKAVTAVVAAVLVNHSFAFSTLAMTLSQAPQVSFPSWSEPIAVEIWDAASLSQGRGREEVANISKSGNLKFERRWLEKL
jgi:hypothetical protein